MVDVCEHGNDYSGAIKCGEFLVEELLVSHEGLCCMDFVRRCAQELQSSV
jgi:hypothetical protein